MLKTLCIKDFLLIDNLEIDFSNGLSIFTGETGAGKSILLEALGLILGKRSNSSFIRNNADQTVLSAVFYIKNNEQIFDLISKYDIAKDEEYLIIKKIINKDGKSKSYINNQIVNTFLVKEISTHLVVIHGQFDNLLDYKNQQNLLDKYGNLGQSLFSVKSVYQDYKNKLTEIHKTEQKLIKDKEQESFLKFSAEEFQTINPQEEEEEKLLNERAILKNKIKLLSNLDNIKNNIYSESGAIKKINSALEIAEKLYDFDNNISTICKHLNNTSSEMQEVESLIEELIKKFQNNNSLNNVEDRLYLLRSLARKNNCLIKDLPKIYKTILTNLENINNSNHIIEKQKVELQKVKSSFLYIAKQLSNSRKCVAQNLESAVSNELPELKLNFMIFKVEIAELDENAWNKNGINSVRFLIKPNPDSPSMEINKIASGGEKSRLTLLIKSILSKHYDKIVLIFDEIDTGVGGSVSAAIGKKMLSIAKNNQVLSITHSPQVASYAKAHFLVTKTIKNNITYTEINKLNKQQRFDEIARMLSGNKITAEAKAAATTLINSAK